MAPRNVRFVWGTPPVPAGRWHGGLLNLKRIPSSRRRAPAASAVAVDPWADYRRHRLHISLRGLLGWGLALSLAGYLAGAAFLHRRLERGDPYNRVTYLDLALPFRWKNLDRLRGQALIDQGRALLAGGRFNEGLSRLRLGLARHPEDHEARLALARIYVALRLGPQAGKLLREGLQHGYPGRDSLEFAFLLAEEADDPSHWAGLCELARARLDELPPEDERRRHDALWLDQHLVRALFAADRASDALALVAQRYSGRHPFRREIAVVHLLDSGRHAEAASLAEAWAADEPEAPEPLRLLVRARRSEGDHAAMDAALARLRALEPAKLEPLLYALAQQHLAGRADVARATLRDILFRHGADTAVYPHLAALLSEFGDGPGLALLARETQDRGLSPSPVLWARLQHAVTRRDWSGVLEIAEALQAAPGPGLGETRQSWLETATRLARACLDASSGVQASLVETVAEKPGPLRLHALLVDALLAADRPETARQILTLADGPYPASRTLAALRPRVEAAVAASAAEPAPDPGAAPEHLASAGSFETAFATCIESVDTEAALALLSSVRRARPDWLPAAEPRLDALELPLRARGEDPLRLRFLAGAVLTRDEHAPEKLLALAQEIAAESAERQAHALLLVKEILRHRPAHPDALGLLLAWEPRPEQPPPVPSR